MEKQYYEELDESNKENNFNHALKKEFINDVLLILGNTNDFKKINSQIEELGGINHILGYDFVSNIYNVSESGDNEYGLKNDSLLDYNNELEYNESSINLIFFYTNRIKSILKNNNEITKKYSLVVDNIFNEGIIEKHKSEDRGLLRTRNKNGASSRLKFLDNWKDPSEKYSSIEIFNLFKEGSINIDSFFSQKQFIGEVPVLVRRFMASKGFIAQTTILSYSGALKFIYKYSKFSLKEKINGFLIKNNISNTSELLGYIKLNPDAKFLGDLSFVKLINSIKSFKNDSFKKTNNYNIDSLYYFTIFLGGDFNKKLSKQLIKDFFNDSKNKYIINNSDLYSENGENVDINSQIEQLLIKNNIETSLDLFIFYEISKLSRTNVGNNIINKLFIGNKGIKTFRYFLVLGAEEKNQSKYTNVKMIHEFSNNMGILSLKSYISDYLKSVGAIDLESFRLYIEKNSINNTVYSKYIEGEKFTLTLRELIIYFTMGKRNFNNKRLLNDFENKFFIK